MELDTTQDINNLFEGLLKGREISHIFDNYDFNSYLHSALENIHKDVSRYIKGHRLDLYQNHYPYFFRPVVNHMLLQINRNNFKQFEHFDIRSNFRFEVSQPDIQATMQSVSPFTYHPFQAGKVEALNQELRININSGSILFNQDELLLWISPQVSTDNLLKAKNLLDKANKVIMAYKIDDELYKIELSSKQSMLYDQPFLMQALLEGVSPEMFGYQAFDIKDIEKIENQQIQIEYISIVHEHNSELPDNLHELFSFNLMPVLSITDDYASNIKIDGSKEYYPVTASESDSHMSFYMENDILLDKQKINKYASSQAESLNYIIRHESNHSCQIKIQSKVKNIINKELQVFGSWTQLLDINKYQDKSIKIMDRDKMAYSAKVIFKNGYVLNDNVEKIDRFIELSNLINYRRFDKDTILAICDISTLNPEALAYLNGLISVDYQQSRQTLILNFRDGTQLEKLKIDYGVKRLDKVLNYLLNENLQLEINMHKTFD